jgi:hypothetical protein
MKRQRAATLAPLLVMLLNVMTASAQDDAVVRKD